MRRGPRFVALVLAVAAGLAFLRLGRAPLSDSEAFYAEVAREMLESGDWMTPRFDYDRFLDKPPLYYWLTLPAYGALGVTEGAARLPAAAAMAGCAALTIALGAALFDLATGCLAGLMLATTMGFSIYSHQVLIEPMLTFFICAALLCFWLFHDGRGRVWLWLFYAGLGLGAMTKGLSALVFPGATVALFLVSSKGLRGLKPLIDPRGWLVAVAINAPWHACMAYRHEGFLWIYFVHEQLFRFLGKRVILDSPLSTPAFLGILLAVLLPWSLLLPQAAAHFWRLWRRDGAVDEPSRFVLTWAGVVLGFFTLSRFKLDYYSMPAWPALMLLLARVLRSRGDARWTAAAALPLGAACLVTLVMLPAAVGRGLIQLPTPWLLGAGLQSLASLSAGALAAGALVRFEKPRAALTCVCAAMLPVVVQAQLAMTRLGPLLSERDLVGAASRCLAALPPGTPLVHAQTDEDIFQGGAVFYARRPVQLLWPKDRPGFPLGRSFYLDPARYAEMWDRPSPQLLLGDADRVSTFLGARRRFTLAENGGRVLASNRPVCGADANLLR